MMILLTPLESTESLLRTIERTVPNVLNHSILYMYGINISLSFGLQIQNVACDSPDRSDQLCNFGNHRIKLITNLLSYKKFAMNGLQFRNVLHLMENYNCI